MQQPFVDCLLRTKQPTVLLEHRTQLDCDKRFHVWHSRDGLEPEWVKNVQHKGQS